LKKTNSKIATSAPKKLDTKIASNNKSAEIAILFDMDGVLVDVSASYRKAIQDTVGFFTGKKAQLKEIQNLKEKGGYNNDWDLTEAILSNRGKIVPKAQIIEKFQELYRGEKGKNGYIENEKWLLSIELLKQLKEKYTLGIVTGRPQEEALFVLKKFGISDLFDVVIAMEDYPPEKAKPDPYPINLALKKICRTKAIYVGDSVDDIVAAKLANIRPIGCIPPKVSAYQLKDLLIKNGAEKVLDNINNINQAIIE
jgi:HAD superfamily hydrolase (TIGR01548 family)